MVQFSSSFPVNAILKGLDVTEAAQKICDPVCRKIS